MNKRICLNKSVLDFMAGVINKQSYVLECGAGWSTRWFAERCGKLLSIETSDEWFGIVRSDLNGTPCNWSMQLIGDPNEIRIEGSPDLCLIDCQENLRYSMTELAWAALATGGWLIFDDAQRPEHASAMTWLNSFVVPVLLPWDEVHDIPEASERVALAFQKPCFTC